MSYDELVGAWALKKWQEQGAEGVAFHEEQFGCTVTASNTRFAVVSDGSCATCYYEYPALVFDVDCTCPTQVPQLKDPTKMRPNNQRFKWRGVELRIYGDEFSLSNAYAEIQEFARELGSTDDERS